tara:strand:- start:583 stop:990 length:408 start_codon:yes stop_codon:yes gene_type:complete
MERNYLKKIIAQSPEDLQTISACCSGAITKVSEIKHLPSNKIFLMSLSRMDKENENNNKKINSIIKFEFVDSLKSKNIDQNDTESILELIAIDIFKKKDNFEIIFLFSEDRLINLTTEVIEVTLEDQKLTNDKNS